MNYSVQKLSTRADFCVIVITVVHKPNMKEVCMTLQSDLAELLAQHKALEAQLSEALEHPASSDQEIAEIKRQKLHLKDEIARLERSIPRAA
jgi:hypothetical protein